MEELDLKSLFELIWKKKLLIISFIIIVIYIIIYNRLKKQILINIKQERAVIELSSRILKSLFFSKSMVKSANIRRKKNRKSLIFSHKR